MDDRVKYNKVSLNFPKIITQLHEKAVEIASQSNGNIKIVNSAFDDSQTNFNGAGEYTLFLTPSDEKPIDIDNKKDYLSFAKEYITYFVGDDAAKLVTDDDLQPMVDLRDVKAPSSETSATTSESYNLSKLDKFINETVNNIFEADESDSSEPNPESPKQEEPEPEKVETCVGFYLTYAIDVEKQKRTRHGVINALGKLGKGIFGGIMTDLKNIELKTLGGGSIKVGKIFDPETYGLGFKIDKTKIESDIYTVIKDAFPRSENVNVRLWDTTTLIDSLRNQKKLTHEIDTSLKDVKYALGIEIGTDDYSYRHFSKQKIADMFNEASHLDEKFTKANLTEKDIFFVNGYISKYKKDSGYDKASKKPTQTQTHNTNNEKTTEKKSVNESTLLVDFTDIVVESMINELFGDKIIIEKRQQSTDWFKRPKTGEKTDGTDHHKQSTEAQKDTEENNTNKQPENKQPEGDNNTNKQPEENNDANKQPENKQPEEENNINKQPEDQVTSTSENVVDLYIIPSKYIDKVEKTNNN